VLSLVLFGAVISTMVSASIGVTSLLVGGATSWGARSRPVANLVAWRHGRRFDRLGLRAQTGPIAAASAQPGELGDVKTGP
jgi:hypothetical protein